MRIDSSWSAGRKWTFAERFLGGRTRDYSPFSQDMEISAAYRPLSSTDAYQLKSFWLDNRSAKYVAGTESPLHNFYRADDRVLLAAHPDTLTALGEEDLTLLRLAEPGPVIECSPLANGRTVAVRTIRGIPVPIHFLKLHLPRRVSRFTRPIRRGDILQHLWTSKLMTDLDMPYLREVGGVVIEPFGKSGGDWGYLVRQSSHVGMRPGDITVPGFALYGRDTTNSSDPCVLDQLLEIWRNDCDPVTLVCDLIVRPLAALWATCALRTGCLIELHGQNVLVSFSDVPLDLRVGFRDGGIFVDPELAQRAGIPDLPPIDVLGRDVQVDPLTVRSLTYDSFFGSHFVARLALHLNEQYAIPMGIVFRAAREGFEAAGGHDIPMPRDVYYYDGRLFDGDNWKLVNTGARSICR